MNKRMRELLAKIEAKQKEARSYMDGENKDVTKATALLDECDSLKAEFEAEKRLFEAEKAEVEPEAEKKVEEKKQTDSVKAFADAARNGFQKDMSEGSGLDGGYTVPEDIVTKIEHYRDAKASLRQHVRVIPVQTMSGARTFKARETVTGFSKVLENGKFAKKATPKFERLAYNINKFGGYFVLSDEVIEDSDANLVDEVVALIGDESRVTDNVEIISAIKAAKPAPVNFEDLDGIKEALNVTLGQAFRATSKIYTNDNGLQFLDTLIDGNNRPLLAPSPVEPMKMVLGCGPTTVEIVVLPNSDFPNLEQGIPFIVGDLNEGVALFDRRRVTLSQSKTASVEGYNAFEQGGLLIRADERADYVVRDAAAFVLGYIAI
ncbi:MAG: phage major capsid protein [Kiritimatiellae bacterium]|nr:phage major capsid protein [Kiritimatiellia bacterium]